MEIIFSGTPACLAAARIKELPSALVAELALLFVSSSSSSSLVVVVLSLSLLFWEEEYNANDFDANE